MQPALLIRLRPLGPWRYGSGEGGNDRLDRTFRSDRLYSAVNYAMRQFGFLEEWLDATARSSTPDVTFSSLFPYQSDTLFAPPPRTLWPPEPSVVTSPSPVFLSKIRWQTAEFVPLAVIDSVLSGRPILAEQWIADPESGCLLRRDRPSTTPFRLVTRNRAAVDRLSAGSIHVDSFACVEFESNSGLWCVARFSDSKAESRWSDRVKATFRFLADSGFGAGRVIGWGQTAQPEILAGLWPRLLLPRSIKAEPNGSAEGETVNWWLLSLYSPASSDSLDWSGGDYQLVTRGGHKKKSLRMVAEGSVLSAPREPIGSAPDVAPEGHQHPIFRSGFALPIRLPRIVEEIKPVEEPSDEEAPEAMPCPTPELTEQKPELQTQTEPESAEAPEPEAPQARQPDLTDTIEPAETDGVEPKATEAAITSAHVLETSPEPEGVEPQQPKEHDDEL